MMFRMMLFAIVCCMANAPAFATTPISPKEIVDILYEPYLADPHAEKPNSTPPVR